MNIVQQIIVAILKNMCYGVLAISLEPEEKSFMQKVQAASYFTDLRVIADREGKYLLVWQSKTGMTMACAITEVGFFFSDVQIYNERDRVLFTIGAGDKWIMLREVKEIKTIFMTYSIDAEVCFK